MESQSDQFFLANRNFVIIAKAIRRDFRVLSLSVYSIKSPGYFLEPQTYDDSWIVSGASLESPNFCNFLGSAR